MRSAQRPSSSRSPPARPGPSLARPPAGLAYPPASHALSPPAARRRHPAGPRRKSDAARSRRRLSWHGDRPDRPSPTPPVQLLAHLAVGDRHAYYDKKIAEGKTHKEALRSLKRRISDAIYARLLADARRAGQRPARRAREGNRGTTLTPARPAHTPNTGSSDKPLPDLGTTIRPGTRAATPSPSKPTSKKTLTTT